VVFETVLISALELDELVSSLNYALSVTKDWAVAIKIDMAEPFPQTESWQLFVRGAKGLADAVNPDDIDRLFWIPCELTQVNITFLNNALTTALSIDVPPSPNQYRMKFKQDEFIFLLIGAYAIWLVILFAYFAYSGKKPSFFKFFAPSYFSFLGCMSR
jgi:hypothetical protein